MHADFAGDESTSVMGVDLLSSLTERSRRIEVATAAVPEPEISIAVEEPEPVTTMRPMAQALEPPPAPAPPQLQIVEGEYPAIGDEESTMTMEEPEPTTVAVRSHIDKPLPVPEPAPVPPLRVEPLPAAAPPEPRWTASLAPRPLEAFRLAQLPAPDMEATASPEAAPSAVWRRLGALALGAAAVILGLGHHQSLPPSAISSSALSATSAVVEPWDVQTHVKATIDRVHVSVAALLQWSASDASVRNESAEPGRAKQRPAARHRQRG